MSIKYSKILATDEALSAGPNDILALAVVDSSSSTGYTTKAIRSLNFVPFTSLTTIGTTGAATLINGVLNIPEYGGGVVDSVTGLNVDNTDPANPIIQISVDGITITGAGTPASPLEFLGSTVGAGLSGTGLPANPLVNEANVYESVTGDSGTTTATTLTDTLTVSGGKGITTDATVADTVSIVADVAKDTSGTTTIGASATVTFTHNLNTFFHSVVVTESGAPYTHFVHGVDYSVSSPTANDVDITDETGAGLTNIRVTVIG
jgi:hypothetical protein